MKRVLLAFAVVTALVGAVVGAKATISAGASNGATAIVGGLHRSAGDCYYLDDGTQTFCAGGNLDLNIDAHGLGSGPATGAILTGTNGAPNSSRTRVTCMTVVGNRAVIGGYITADTGTPSFVGYAMLFYVIDNGGPGNN